MEALRHPNMVQIYEWGRIRGRSAETSTYSGCRVSVFGYQESEHYTGASRAARRGIHYISMELLQSDLYVTIAESGAFGMERAASVLGQLLSALLYIHGQDRCWGLGFRASGVGFIRVVLLDPENPNPQALKKPGKALNSKVPGNAEYTRPRPLSNLNCSPSHGR